MKNHEDIIDRMAAANPVPDLDMITDGQLAELMLQVEQERTASTRTGERSLEAQEPPASRRTGRGPRSRWFKPVVAFASALVAVLVVLGIVGLLRSDPAAVVDEPAPSPTTVPSATSTMAPGTATAPVAPPPGASTASSDRTNRIRSLAVAGDGSLWAATADGVVRWDLDTQTPTIYTTDHGLPSGGAAFVETGPDGSVWARGDGWMARFDGALTTFSIPNGDPFQPVDVEADGTTWILQPDMSGFGVVDADGTFWAPSKEAGGGIVGSNGGQTTRLVVPVDESTAASSTTTIVPAAGEWNPILADTRAGPAAVASTCPAGADPAVAGSANQDRPAAGWAGLLAGAFDNRTGRIVYLDEARETWTFDVCTNTWLQLRPTGEVPGDLSAGLVYDADSDVTVAFGFNGVSVYDASANTWAYQNHNPLGAGPGQFAPMGAVYDPVSGLIVTTELTDGYLDAWAYDADTNTWTLIGRLWDGGDDYVWFELLGYSREADRLIFTSVNNLTALVDPRTGTKTIIETATPGIDLVWPGAQYGPAADSTFVAKGTWVHGGVFDQQFPDQICGFDINTSTWTLCVPMPGSSGYAAFAAMVGDPINDRLVLVHGVYGNFWGRSDDGVWAIALDTGETVELLAPSERREPTGPS